MMSDDKDLRSKRELAKHFSVSQTTVNNWLERGMPVASAPDGSFGGRYLFNLDDVLAWRAKMTSEGRPQGGTPLETLPPAFVKHPHWQNGCRFLAEQSVRDYIHHWAYTEDCAQMTLGFLIEAFDGDEQKARSALALVYLGLFHAFTGWLVEDDLNRFLEAHGYQGIDGLWERFTGAEIATNPPCDREAIQLHVPDYLWERPPHDDE